MQVSRFELWFKSIYPLLLLQKNDIGDKNQSTVNAFFKSSKTWFKEFSWWKGFLFEVRYCPYLFQSEKITK